MSLTVLATYCKYGNFDFGLLSMSMSFHEDGGHILTTYVQ